jgi:uncharacterized protein
VADIPANRLRAATESVDVGVRPSALALLFFIGTRINSLSVATARWLFFGYAALVGVSLSTLFHIYTNSSITRVFFITAATFGALSLFGYTTRRDLSGPGTFI